MKRIRVLVVDDSALMRKLIPELLRADPGIEIAGTAMDGLFALKKIRLLRPDVVTLDVNMPRMDGIETLRRIVDDLRVPVIMVSSLTHKDAGPTLQALEIGAFDFVAKPRNAISLHMAEIGSELIAKVHAAAAHLATPHLKPLPRPIDPVRKGRYVPSGASAARVLAIGISTGGPNALSYLLPQIPRDFPAGILIVQHMPVEFTGMFAERLNALCAIEVKEARDGDLVLPGRALIAPGNRHLRVKRMPLGTIAVLSDAPPVSGHRPSADVLFQSAASEFGNSATGLIMTGMGKDGARGIEHMKARGGVTIAQDEKSCAIFGMPKAAIDRKCIDHVVPLRELGRFLADLHKEAHAEETVCACAKAAR